MKIKKRERERNKEKHMTVHNGMETRFQVYKINPIQT